MIDWFAALTPLLVLPIGVLFLFVGCSLIFSSDDSPNLKFDINFYVDNSVLIQNHVIEFRIKDSGTPLDSAKTDDINVSAPGEGNNASRVSHIFSSRELDPGPATLTCQVVDITDPTNEVTLVADGVSCMHDFEEYREYRLVFNAGISTDGTVPNDEFDDCHPIQL